MHIKGSKKKNQVLSVNIFEQQEIIAKADAIKAELKASTWHELETKGKFDKNDKLSFVSAIRKKADYEYRYYKTTGNGAVQNRR